MVYHQLLKAKHCNSRNTRLFAQQKWRVRLITGRYSLSLCLLFHFQPYDWFSSVFHQLLISIRKTFKTGKSRALLTLVREVWVQALAESLCCLLGKKKLLEELERLGVMPWILVYALLLIVKISYQVPRSWLLFFLQAAKTKRETDKQEMDLEIVSDSNESKGKKNGMLNGKWVGFLQNASVKK